VPQEVIDFAARLLPTIAPQLEPPTSVRRSRGELALLRARDVVPAGADAVASPAAERVGSTGVVVPDALVTEVAAALAERSVHHGVLGTAEEPDERDTPVDVVPASLAKGLEFDHVVLLEPAAIVAAEPDRTTGLRRLYVCLTRAVSSLVVVHSDDLPPELSR
jgi:DNA helicase IV